ncbi:hypothetical protein NDU88_006619 [Pleurodeles waltl]|uniref:Uncharacterized protein n=1 Tax=Pleurodeles waltl TaxID=8319 RepID=A0AAV7PRU9_PLEWA|nr:hypothetical protein NDU88_006619 [Pleurodeles waltl]
MRNYRILEDFDQLSSSFEDGAVSAHSLEDANSIKDQFSLLIQDMTASVVDPTVGFFFAFLVPRAIYLPYVPPCVKSVLVPQQRHAKGTHVALVAVS